MTTCKHEWYDNPGWPLHEEWCAKCYKSRLKPIKSPVVERNEAHKDDKFTDWHGVTR